MEATTAAVDELLDRMKDRTNLIGVPLINWDDMERIWQIQRKHVVCLQDPIGVQLYEQTGTSKKGGIVLPIYRCGRGSSSTESLHNHLITMIPGIFGDILYYEQNS